ncbi:DUF3857 domain-containing protein [Flaviaesturariibacter amylovorans]|uniref:DUF3857 domain-containing protein n=1 Tax=Flaviaesturariibacter amylovorans TaxID=1084520 RepID=A0ABP8GK29_9BACT
MYRSLLLFCLGALLCRPALAQAPELGVTVEEEFKNSTVPDKWKNESAVILGSKVEYLFSRPGGRNPYAVRINEYVHKRVRLQDKAALEKFSTFYYVTMGAEGKATYQVIKAGGQAVDVDMKSALEDEQEVPAIYRPIYYKMSVKKMKIAIPNLEVGDIIDYTIRSTMDWDMKTNGIQFVPFIFSLSNNYPTLYQQYRFTMANGMKVRYRAFNGAPNMRYDPKASVYGDKNSYLSYYFLDKDREKSVEERWSYELRSMPSVKFRVVLLADNDPDSKGLGEAMVDRSGLNIEDVYKAYAGAAMYTTPTVNTLVAYTTEYINAKRAEGALKNEDDIVKETYYCLRKAFLEMYYKGPVHSELEKYFSGRRVYRQVLKQEKKEAGKKEEREDEIRMNIVTFSTALRSALAVQRLPAELYVYVPRKLGAWRDAIFMEELDFVMKVKGRRKYYYLEAFNNFDAFGTPRSYLESVEGYSIGYEQANSYYRTTVPASAPDDNFERKEFAIAFSDALDAVNVERTSSYLGAEKSDVIAQANLDREYLNRDFQKYFVASKKKDASPEPPRYDDPDKELRIKDRKEIFEKTLKSEFDVDQYGDFVLLQDGRSGDTSLLQFRESFRLRKMISKAGRNFLFDIGKLIGGQIKLEESELKERQTDIYLSTARSIENNISITIPAGYSVEGLQELNVSVDNESGTFVSTAKVEDNKLLVTTRKVYKKNFDPKANWPNYVAFLEPAYKFSQAKVVFKKKP